MRRRVFFFIVLLLTVSCNNAIDTGSLCCDNAEEAKSLIPSLHDKITDADLQELLDELTKLRNFTE